MEDQSVQLSLDHVESLVHRLYQQTSPEIITATQTSLSRFQDSKQAWHLIPGLLERPDEKVKFFGVLTIIIKLNKESSSLYDEDAIELLNRLIGWLMDSLDHSTGHLVPRKLSSAMATFYLHFHRLWPRFLRHLVACLASHQLIDFDAADQSSSIVAALLDSLQPRQLRAALWVMTNIVEDVSRMDLNATNKDLFDDMMQNIPDAMALMAKGLSTLSAVPAVHGDSTRCFQSLIHLAMKSLQADSHIVSCLKPLAEVVIESISVDNLFDASAELLVDIIVNTPSLLNQEQYVLLARLFEAPWAQERYRRLLQGDFSFESMQFGQLILTFGENKTETLMRSVDDSSQQILSALCGLLTAEGHPVLEDKIFVLVVEFWSSFVEAMTDVCQPQPGEPSPPWVSLAISHVSKAASNAWRKIIYPPQENFCLWDSSDRIGFNDARNDVIDFMQSTYTIVGPMIAENFANLVLSALANAAWLPLEAAAFCLGGLADCSRGDSLFDQALNAVFTSPLFSVLRTESSSVPLRTWQTCFTLIERYSEYFERNVGLLTPVLDMLFAMLHDHCMAASASKAILRLCSSYRRLLHTAATEFVVEYDNLVHGKHLNCITSERVIGAISSVAQAIPVASERYDACTRILEFVQRDVKTVRQLSTLSSGIVSPCQSLKCFGAGESPALHMGLRALRCLVSVGKAFQSPLQPTIKIEDPRVSSRILTPSEQLVSLHKRILGIITELQSLLGANSEIIELISGFLRCGFSETDPGPFVFQPNMVAQFLTNHTERIPRVCLLVSTACSFASSMHSTGCLETQEIVTTLLLWVIELLKQLPGPEYDPELSQNGLEFTTRILARTPRVVLDLRPTKSAEFLFMFAIQVLDGHEPLPKGAAAEFWATFVGLRDGDSQVQHLTQQAMNTLGPLLAQSLARNLGGNASRSELDKLSEPVKKLVSRHPMAREWLQNGLEHASFPSTRVNAEQKALFVRKLIRFVPPICSPDPSPASCSVRSRVAETEG